MEDDFPDFEATRSYVGVQDVTDFARWCMVRGDRDYVTEIIDKPIVDPQTSTALNGTYFFNDGKLIADLAKSSIYKLDGAVESDAEISGFLVPYCNAYQVKLRRDIPLRDFGTLEEYLNNRDVTPHRTFNTISTPEATAVNGGG